MNSKKSAKLIGKNQFSALVATAIDYSVFAFLIIFFRKYYLFVAALSAIVGAVVNYSLNRKWTFKSINHKRVEATKYAVVSSMSLLWNVLLVWIGTEIFKLNPMYSKIFAGFTVGIFWNFSLHRYWVFVK